MKNIALNALLIVVICLISLLFCAIIPGCSTTKEVAKEVVKYDSVAIRKVDSLSIEMTSLKTKYEKLKQTASQTGVVFRDVPCPDVKIDSTCNQDSLVKVIRQQQDYIRSLKNSVKVNADGSIELQGQIASFNQDIQKMERALQESDLTIIDLTKKSDSLTIELSKLKSLSTKNKKSTFLNQWWLFPAGMLFMAAIIYRKKIRQIFT